MYNSKCQRAPEPWNINVCFNTHTQSCRTHFTSGETPWQVQTLSCVVEKLAVWLQAGNGTSVERILEHRTYLD